MNSGNPTALFKTFMKSILHNGPFSQRTVMLSNVDFGKYWKILLTVFALLLSAQTATYATQIVTFQWLANAESDLAGYRVYQTDTRGQYIFGPLSPQLAAEIPADPDPGGVVTHTLTNVPDGTWYWVVTAFDTAGLESGPSNEVPPPSQDTTLSGDEGAVGCFIDTVAAP